jgi:hypothetical protein
VACGLRNFLHAHVYAAAVRPLSEYQYRTPSPVRLELGGQSERSPPRFSSFPPRSSIGEAVNANTRCKADADRLLLYSTYRTVHVHAGQKFKFRVLIAFKPRCRGCRQLPIFVHLSPITYASLRLPVYCGTRSPFHSISRRNPSPLHLPGVIHVPTSTSRLETTS